VVPICEWDGANVNLSQLQAHVRVCVRVCVCVCVGLLEAIGDLTVVGSDQNLRT
jgi:hypothetical protein